MKKRLIIIGIIVLLFILGIYIVYKNLASSVTTIENVSVEIKEGTLSNRGAAIVITNNSKKNVTFGEDYSIERNILGKWFKMRTKTKDIWFNLVSYEVAPGEKREFEEIWDAWYGRLGKGKYRLIKELNGKRIAVEFEI